MILSKLVFHSRMVSSRLEASVIENVRCFAVYSLLIEQEIVKDKSKPPERLYNSINRL